MGPDGPKWGQEDFFLLIQTLPTFWATRILILKIHIFKIFFGVPDFWISRFLDFQIQGCHLSWLAQGQGGAILDGTPGPQNSGDPRNLDNTVRTPSVQALFGENDFSGAEQRSITFRLLQARSGFAMVSKLPYRAQEVGEAASE